MRGQVLKVLIEYYGQIRGASSFLLYRSPVGMAVVCQRGDLGVLGY